MYGICLSCLLTQVFREPKLASQVDAVLSQYARCIEVRICDIHVIGLYVDYILPSFDFSSTGLVVLLVE